MFDINLIKAVTSIKKLYTANILNLPSVITQWLNSL